MLPLRACPSAPELSPEGLAAHPPSPAAPPQVLKLQPGNAKALFRRGLARHALGQTESALVDLTEATEK